jgi:hypothetical protein
MLISRQQFVSSGFSNCKTDFVMKFFFFFALLYFFFLIYYVELY